ncbi:thiol:disulfide interchange protein DsbA/DsbL [Aquitalea magnusonii]|uniref:Thiol:disulfide interchange protein n=1 Tax=Aquitalea magnusonii TaxID=332411 RepID=A0A318J9K4_9NEIS|nr:thiol:disulfide interchange protein DsbA/DsbL [Aquitalea magnusonii]PXX44442.1 thiol:disulfide interchange protein DsbA [Aquitalea magnusonii]
MKKWLMMGLLLLSGAASAASELGKDYVLMSKPQPVANPKKVEVIEFFSYTCIHCFHLDPLISAWEKKKPAYVDYHREQIVWQKPMEGFARLFATLNATGTMEKLNSPVFDAVMQKKINLGEPAILSDWLKKQPGVNVSKFMQTYNSFGINSQVARASQITRAYNIEGTPTIVINGKYALAPAAPERLIEVMNDVIAKAKAESNIK